MKLVDLVARRAEGYRHGEEVPFDPDWGSDREQLWLLLGEAENIQRAARDLVEGLKADFARTLSENESVRMGDTVYKMSTERTERITDPGALIAWLGSDWHHVVPVTGSTRLKKGGINAVCEQRGLEPDVFEDTFLDVSWGDRRLAAIPISKAPQYAQGLSHGESTFGRKP
jgi:hypothetical protein